MKRIQEWMQRDKDYLKGLDGVKVGIREKTVKWVKSDAEERGWWMGSGPGQGPGQGQVHGGDQKDGKRLVIVWPERGRRKKDRGVKL